MFLFFWLPPQPCLWLWQPASYIWVHLGHIYIHFVSDGSEFVSLNNNGNKDNNDDGDDRADADVLFKATQTNRRRCEKFFWFPRTLPGSGLECVMRCCSDTQRRVREFTHEMRYGEQEYLQVLGLAESQSESPKERERARERERERAKERARQRGKYRRKWETTSW